MDQARMLTDRYFGSHGELHLAGVPISQIVAQYGTPLFVYDSHVLDAKWQLLRECFPPEFGINYSVKANPNPAIIRHFLTKGSGLEIASGGEFMLALNAGCHPGSMLFAGPGKTEAELEIVLARGIGEIHLESRREAERIGRICRRLGVRARVAIRVNPSAEAQGGAMVMGGRAVPFGIDEEEIDSVLDHLLSDSTIDFKGIHLFSGTQILDYEILITQYRKAIEIAKRIKLPLQTIDLGGGLGIPYFQNERELDLDELGVELRKLTAEIRDDPVFAKTRFIVEPGRFLVGEAGVYVTRVLDIKLSRGKKFLIVDGGMHHHLAASGNLGQTIKRNYPLALLSRLRSSPQETVDVVGPLCTPLDVLARSVTLPHAEIGDLLGVFQSGAYARTASPMGFLSHPTPAEVWMEGGKHFLIRRRGEYSDLLQDVCPLDPQRP
jgi:diaminopimelate decarboxylase